MGRRQTRLCYGKSIGGEDRKVNLWVVGKPDCVMVSLQGEKTGKSTYGS